MKRYLIIGAGFSGAVLARELVENCDDVLITIIDERDHIAGNCHTERDTETGVMEHKYGPHIFHTSNEKVWNYVNRHTRMMPFINRPRASIEKGIFSLPINLHTINQFFDKKFSPDEAKEFVKSLGDQSIDEPQNFEEQALKFLGKDLYYAFFHGYTVKQWGCDPKELPASILKRLPVRFDYNDNYFNDTYQGIPEHGYTALIASILDHPRIQVKLSTKYDRSMSAEYDATFYTGELDRFFEYSLGRLSYRTVFWDKTIHDTDQIGNALMNYPEVNVPYTRMHEHKYFTPWESHEKSIVLTEYSKETENGDIPYYPKRLPDDLVLLEKYQAEARKLENVYFLGRLATYRYLDMHQIIGEALTFASHYLSDKTTPVFSNEIS